MQVNNKKLNFLKQNTNKIFIFFAVYVLGIVLGAFFLGDKTTNSILYTNAKNYHVIIFDRSYSFVTIFFKCFSSGILLSLITIILGLSVYSIPFISIIIFYRGIILGTAFTIFYSISGLSGTIIFIILTLPVNVIITAGLIIASVLNYKNANSCDLKAKIFSSIKNAFISIIISLIASLYLTFIMITIIRPINLFF